MQAALILGTAAYSAYAQNQAGQAQKDLANRNGKLLDATADDAIKRGEEDVIAVRRRTRQLVGQQRANYAGQGVEVGSGTALDIQNETDELGAADEATVRRNSWREAWGIKQQASNQRLGGRYAAQAGRNQAIGSFLGGVSQSRPYWSDSTTPKVK